jgi:hypothetical protein
VQFCACRKPTKIIWRIGGVHRDKAMHYDVATGT